MVGSVMPDATPTSPHLTVPQHINPEASYAVLKARIKERGLLEKQSLYVVTRAIGNVIMFIISMVILFATDTLWIQIPNAIFLGFIFVQFGFIAHDVGHRQAFRTPSTANIFGLIHGPLMLGMSFGWWMNKHNEHHAQPNVQDVDPDIDFPFIAFSEVDAHRKRGFNRFLVKIQAYLFPIIILFTSFSLRVGSIEFLINNKWKHRLHEVCLMIAHFIWFYAVVFAALPVGAAIIFVVVQQAFFGLYMSSVFAPNHKGMLIVEEEMNLDFMLKQILTARNVKSHPLTDYFYGGLNYQIEHHLFPSMAQSKLREAQKIIKEFCSENQIPYYETSIVRSYVEILQYLDSIASVLRGAPIQNHGNPMESHS